MLVQHSIRFNEYEISMADFAPSCPGVSWKEARYDAFIAILIHVFVGMFMGSVDKRLPRFLRITCVIRDILHDATGVGFLLLLEPCGVDPRSLDMLKRHGESGREPGGRVLLARLKGNGRITLLWLHGELA